MTKGARIHNGEKTVSSTNGAGKTGHYMQKNVTGPPSNIVHKNKLKMYYGSNCET